jgi:hypothetical protein
MQTPREDKSRGAEALRPTPSAKRKSNNMSPIANYSSNVIHFRRPGADPDPRQAWRHLTKCLVMEKHRRGELDPAIVEYLLAGVGLNP